MTEISTDPRHAQGEISKDELMRRNEEMENYRMALAYIAKQSTDQESRELAQTALDAGQPQSPISPEELRKKAADAIRTFCRSLSPAAVQMSRGQERIYYSGISLEALAAAVVIALSNTRPDRPCK